MDDDEAHAFYSDPANERPGRRVVRQSAMSDALRIRFPVEMIERARVAAAGQGRTVSGWIRFVVQRELDRTNNEGE